MAAICCPLAGLLDGFRIGMFLTNQQRKIVVANETCAHIFEIPVSEWPGMAIDELYTRVQLPVQPVEALKPYEALIKVSSGPKNILSRTLPLRQADGTSAGELAVITDVTGLRKQNAAIARQEQLVAVGQLAAGLAHEIRNPLASIRGFSQLLDGLADDEKSRRYLQTVIHEVDRMNNLIENFMELSKPHNSRIVEVDLNGLIREILILVESQCFLNQIEVRVDPREIPNIQGDRDKIKQVVLNIINNAIEAMEHQQQPRVLTIATRATGSNVEVHVVDNGCGIPEQLRNKIGEPFFSTKEKGTGLGLSICYRIIEQHGGKITVHSREQFGTRFTIILPGIHKE